jgi:hypothetical protein
MPCVETCGVSRSLTTSTRTSQGNSTRQNLNFTGQRRARQQGATTATLDVNGSYLLIVKYVHVLYFHTGLDNDSQQLIAEGRSCDVAMEDLEVSGEVEDGVAHNQDWEDVPDELQSSTAFRYAARDIVGSR